MNKSKKPLPGSSPYNKTIGLIISLLPVAAYLLLLLRYSYNFPFYDDYITYWKPWHAGRIPQMLTKNYIIIS